MRIGPIVDMLRSFLIGSDVGLCRRSDGGQRLGRMAEEAVLKELAVRAVVASRAKQSWEDEITQEIDPYELKDLRGECRKSFFVPARAPEKEVPEGV